MSQLCIFCKRGLCKPKTSEEEKKAEVTKLKLPSIEEGKKVQRDLGSIGADSQYLEFFWQKVEKMDLGNHVQLRN